ncbi:MAG: ribonuclease R [Mycoplasma sp.]
MEKKENTYQEILDNWVKKQKAYTNKKRVKVKEFEEIILQTLYPIKIFKKINIDNLWHVIGTKYFIDKKTESFYGRNEFVHALINLKNKSFLNIKVDKEQNIVVTLIYYPYFPKLTNKTYKGKVFMKGWMGAEILKDGDKERKYFVHASQLNNALHHDTVEFQLLDTTFNNEKIFTPEGLEYVTITDVINRDKTFYVCEYKQVEDKLTLVPDDTKLRKPIIVENCSNLKEGQKVLVKINKITTEALYGTIARIIGDKTDLGIDILSAVLDKGVHPEFSKEVLQAADKLELNLDFYQKKIRRDLTKLPICTIDPATSKDFDDAIYVKKLDNGNYQLIVCIADVAHYVRRGSILNDNAIERGTSIYLADRVIPMLPSILSDDLCSLNYNVIRLTMTAEIEFDKLGKIVKYDVYPSYIKSHRRFSYDEVNQYFKGKSKLAKDKKSVIQMLNDARELHHILDQAKLKRGYVKFNLNEPQIILDETGKAIDIKLREHGEAQEMIEDFMVSANEVVTKFAKKHKLDFIYRVHDVPSPEKIANLRIEAKKLDFKIDSDLNNIKPQDISRWIEKNKGNPNQELINLLLLRTMAKAEYKTKDIGHFGLALKDYTHFTSPIRRLSDLIVGQILWMNIFDHKSYTDKERNKLKKDLNQLCEICSATELVASDCERDVNNMKFAEYMEQHLNKEYVGYVSGITKFGIFVELENTINGFISVKNLYAKGYFVFDEKRKMIYNKHQTIVFSLGTRVKIKVLSSNKESRQINFDFVSLVK